MTVPLAFLTRLVSITLLVLSLDLVTGYCGVATLGQAALFGVAAYAVGNACIAGLTNPFLLLMVGMLAGVATGIPSGLLVGRFRGLQQLVLSIAFGELVAALANKLTPWTGGSDGLSGITPAPVFGVFDFDLYGRTPYWLSVGTLAVIMAALAAFVRSPFSLTCEAIRDDDLRARMIGLAVYPRLVAMYAVSGAVAGAGGALSAITTGVVGLDSVSFERSAEVLVMLVLGGAGCLWGRSRARSCSRFSSTTSPRAIRIPGSPLSGLCSSPSSFLPLAASCGASISPGGGGRGGALDRGPADRGPRAPFRRRLGD